MNLKTVLKINFLVMALGLTLFSIFSLKQKGISPNFLTLFGIETDAKSNEFKDSINWCRTRVTGILVPDQFKIHQRAHEWIFEGALVKTLDFVAMEKWLASSCKVGARLVSGENLPSFTPAVVVKYVDNTVEVIKKGSNDEYLWGDKVFLSPEMSAALDKLQGLPPAQGKAK